MSYLLCFVFLVLIALNSFAKSFSKEIIAVSDNNTEALDAIPIRGPIFISTVYPCTEIGDSLIDMIDNIDQAYEFGVRK